MFDAVKRGIIGKAKRFLALGAIVTVIILSLARSGYAERKDIVLAQFDWPASIGITHILKYVLNEKLDVHATIMPLAQDVGWKTIEKGILDAAPEIWWPARKAEIDLYVHTRKTVSMSLCYDNVRQGFLVPTWVSKKYGITDIDGLKRKAKIFDLDGDGKGDIWAGAIDWSAAEITKIKVRDYNLELDPFTEDVWVFLARFQKAMKQKQPIVFYYWEPEWLFSKYDVTWIKEPKYDPKKWIYVKGAPDQSYIACAWPPAKIYTIFSKKLKDRIPKAYQLFKNFHMSVAYVNFVIAEIEKIPGNPKKDPDNVAEKRVKGHPAIVNEWLKGTE